ncbi:MAG: O-antigen ligase family protein [Betaproteobacteria bacterium]
MIRRLAEGIRFPVEVTLLGCLAISLPMFEGAKNVFWGLYALAWYFNRLRPGVTWETLGGRWDGWDTLFAVLIVSAPAGAALAGLHHQEWIACADALRITSVAWFLKRSGYGDQERLRLHVTIQIAVVIACVWALVALAFPHTYEGIQLHSVGHVNQSVIYIVICFGALIGGVAAYWRVMNAAWRSAAIGAIVVQLVALFAAGSRAGAATAILGALAFGLLWVKRSRGPLAWTAIAVVAFAVLVSSFDTDMRRKQEFALDSPHPVLNERYPIWQQALAAWRAYPAFGVGGDNFGDISAARVDAWTRAAGGRYEAGAFVRSSHAHNLYLNTLAEHGLFGMAALVLLCAAWAWRLFRRKPAIGDPPVAWLAWSGAAAALVVTLGLGAFNTTLHDEHGLLALMMLGIWLSERRGRAATSVLR